MSDTPVGETAGGSLLLANTLAMVRRAFEEEWPPGHEAIPPGPLQGRTSDQALAERETWWRQRTEADDLVWKFVVSAPLMDRAQLAISSNKFMDAIHEKALETMRFLVERRPDETPN